MAEPVQEVPQEEPEWVKAQKRTFTNWVNLQIADRDLKCEDLVSDMGDGISFVNLVEAITGKSVGPYSKESRLSIGSGTTKGRQNALNARRNIDLALDLLTKTEGMKLGTVGSVDLVNGEERIVLGLIWQLILKYHVSSGASDTSAKKELLAWINSKIGKDTPYKLDIKNFKSDWADGKALLALCDALTSVGNASVVDWNTEMEAEARAKKGIKYALSKLRVPDILSPADMGDDEFSMIVYLSYFYNLHSNTDKANEHALLSQAAKKDNVVVRLSVR